MGWHGLAWDGLARQGTAWAGALREGWDHEIGAMGRRNKKVARADRLEETIGPRRVGASKRSSIFLEPPLRNKSFPGRLGSRRHRSILSHSVAGMAR